MCVLFVALPFLTVVMINSLNSSCSVRPLGRWVWHKFNDSWTECDECLSAGYHHLPERRSFMQILWFLHSPFFQFCLLTFTVSLIQHLFYPYSHYIFTFQFELIKLLTFTHSALADPYILLFMFPQRSLPIYSIRILACLRQLYGRKLNQPRPCFAAPRDCGNERARAHCRTKQAQKRIHRSCGAWGA
jgi:hypothetical protein